MISQIHNKSDQMVQNQKQEIANSTFKIQPDNFFNEETPTELNTDSSTDLDRQLTESSEPFSTMGISSIKTLFYEVGIDHVTKDQVQNFLNRLPRIEHLDYHQSTFEIIRFLCQNPDFAILIYDSQVLNYINYSTFETVDDQIKTFVSDIVLEIITAEPEAINTFLTNFFPYFYNNLKSNDLFENGGLATHLQLAIKFIQEIDDQNQIEAIFKRFTLFIHHGDSDVTSASLKGILYSIKYHPFLLRDSEFSSDIFIDRLVFLCSNKNKKTGPLVFIIFGHLVCNNFKYPQNTYKKICQLLITYMSLSEDTGRKDAISLIGFAFSNPSFVDSLSPNLDYSPFDKLMSSFLEAYRKFKLSEKREAVYVFANFFGFIPNEIIQRYASNDLFFTDLIDTLEFDEPQVLIPLLNGLDKPLKVNPDTFTLSQKAALIDSISELTKLDDDHLARTADYIIKQLSN